LLGLGLFFSFLILYRGGRTTLVGDQLIGRMLPIDRTTHADQTHTDIMLRVGFEPMIPVFDLSETVHALDPSVVSLAAILNTAPEYKTSIHKGEHQKILTWNINPV
jgi:hypothetical protein